MSDASAASHRVIVDTNVVVDVLRGSRHATVAIRERIEAGQVLCMSVLTRFELGAGARPNETDSLSEHLDLYDHVEVDSNIADRAAALARAYRKSHSAIDPIDYMIAATTEVHADELLTLNVKHFPMFPNIRPAYRTTT